MTTFWKTVKPFLSGKIASTLKITLIDNDEIANNFIIRKKLNPFLQTSLVILRSLITVTVIH